MDKIPLQVEVKEITEKHVIFLSHTGPYKGDSKLFEELFGKLFQWAGPRNLIRFPKTEMLTVYHDDPDITKEEESRISLCLTVPENTEVDGEVEKMIISGGKYAIGHFLIAADQYQDAWNKIFMDWLPESAYQADCRPCFEIYLNNPKEHPEKKHQVDIYIPIKPL